MSDRDFTTALARLLTDRSLLESYRVDARETAERLSVRPSDVDAFLSLDAADLEAQAETLVRKRFHEVAGMIPETITGLGGREEARHAFEEYAATRWPGGHRRHLADAVAFCAHLLGQERRTVCRAEYHRLRFVLCRRRFAIHLVRDLVVDGRARPALQILYGARGDSPRQIALFVALPFRSGCPSSSRPSSGSRSLLRRGATPGGRTPRRSDYRGATHGQ